MKNNNTLERGIKILFWILVLMFIAGVGTGIGLIILLSRGN